MKTALNGFIRGLKKNSKLENITIKTSKTEKQREETRGRGTSKIISKNCGTTTNDIIYMNTRRRRKRGKEDKKHLSKNDLEFP